MQSNGAAEELNLCCHYHLCCFRAFNTARLRALLDNSRPVWAGAAASDAAFSCPGDSARNAAFSCTGESARNAAFSCDIGESARAVACVGDTGQSARNAAFSCDIGESARNAALSCDTGKSARNAALPCETGDSARIVALPCDSGKSVNIAASPSNAGKSCDGHSVRAIGRSCDAGDVAPDVVSSRHAVSSTCFMVHDGLGGGASKLCSDRSKTLLSAVGTNLFGNFNASVARFASSAVTVMLSCAGQGTCKRFKCLRHSSKHASVCAGARKYSCAVCKITGAAPCGFRSGAKM